MATLFPKGKLINVEPDYSSQAEEFLSRAVKLNPGQYFLLAKWQWNLKNKVEKHFVSLMYFIWRLFILINVQRMRTFAILGLVQAWNELGESYSRKDDFTNARICFEGALQHERCKLFLLSLPGCVSIFLALISFNYCWKRKFTNTEVSCFNW